MITPINVIAAITTILVIAFTSCNNNEATTTQPSTIIDTVFTDSSLHPIDKAFNHCLTTNKNIENCCIEYYENWKDTTTTFYQNLLTAANNTERTHLQKVNAAFELQLKELTIFIDQAAQDGRASMREDRLEFLAQLYKQYYNTLQQINNYITY